MGHTGRQYLHDAYAGRRRVRPVPSRPSAANTCHTSKACLPSAAVELEDAPGTGPPDAQDDDEPFNMAYLALRGSAHCHRRQPPARRSQPADLPAAFPALAACEVPVGHVTNGVHVPTWDSAEADRLWTEPAARNGGVCRPSHRVDGIAGVSDEDLWAMRGEEPRTASCASHAALATQLSGRGHPHWGRSTRPTRCSMPNVLTLGFARRFTEYKRPNLLLRDRESLARLLLNEKRPVQIVVAGKAHPADIVGKAMIQEWIEFARQPRFAAERRVSRRLRHCSWRRSLCRAWTSGSTRRAGPGKHAAPAA